MFIADGVIHIHSTFSDGTATVEEIVASAKKNGLNFVVLTDHDNLTAFNQGYEGYHDGVLLLCGYEITPQKNHYLVLGTDELIKEDGGPQEFIPKVRDCGGLGFIAHPDHVGAPKFGIDRYDWTRWEVDGFTGIGIWDLMTDWQERMTGLWAGVKGVMNPLGHIRGPRAVTLRRWDEMNRRRRVVGIGEIDNHGAHKWILFIRLTIFPYDFAMGTVQNHILLKNPLSGDFKQDRRSILDALKAGRLYVSLEAFAPSEGFLFWGEQRDKQKLYPGDRIRYKPGIILKVTLSRKAQMKLLCDGEVVAFKMGKQLEHSAFSPGVYRVEVYLPPDEKFTNIRPWVFSNPIVLTERDWGEV